MLIDHVLIYTKDLPAMQRFFEEVVCLVPGERPPFPGNGTWLYSKGRPIIHLAASSSHGTNGAIDHIAFTGGDYQSLITRLSRYKYKYVEQKVPGSNEHQVIVNGPEGVSLEIQFPAGSVE